jgi:hypothetical protein
MEDSDLVQLHGTTARALMRGDDWSGSRTADGINYSFYQSDEDVEAPELHVSFVSGGGANVLVRFRIVSDDAAIGHVYIDHEYVGKFVETNSIEDDRLRAAMEKMLLVTLAAYRELNTQRLDVAIAAEEAEERRKEDLIGRL